MARKLRMNPLRRYTVMVANEESGETVEKEEPMTWEDAAKVSAVITLAQIFIMFLPKYAWGGITGDFAEFCFALLVFSGQTFFASFIALTGLSWVSKPKP